MKLLHPGSTYIDPSIPEGAIAEDALVHPGCRILGETTCIGPGSEIGREAPVTLIDCQLGAAVKIAGGFCEGSVFLDGANTASGAHIRPGCLLEEEAGVAHTAGLKQTILLPFVTCGSLINFCDCLMSGGTSRKDHSEVGSSFIHFNFTPHADKATPSLLGDVPHGVLLNQPPIFLGGQGGIVGPVHVAFGTVLAAGSILRHDVDAAGHLVLPGAVTRTIERPYSVTHYKEVRRRMQANLVYLGNLFALRSWYRAVRVHYLPPALQAGALRVLDLVIAERRKWLGRMADKLAASQDWLEGQGGNDELVTQHTNWLDAWPLRAAAIENWSEPPAPGLALDTSGSYIKAVQNLDAAQQTAITTWLSAIVASIASD